MTNPTINFGTIEIPAFDLAVSGNIILGTRSAGKTTLIKFISEELMSLNIPIIVCDPVGKSRYLKNANPNNPNGKGFDVIVVGKNGDIPLSVDTIEDVVRMALKTRSSLVIDLFDPEILDSWDEIMVKVSKVLLYENEDDVKNIHNGLRTLIIDESSEFVHQESKKTGASVWIERLIRMSGNSKVGVVLVNQESETISKKVLKLCRNRIIGCQTEYNSINNIRKWMNRAGMIGADSVAESLPSLESGEFYVWSKKDNTLVKTKIPQIKTLHPSRNDMSVNDIRPADGLNSVISLMKNLQPVVTGSIPFSQVVNFILPVTTSKPTTGVNIDMGRLSSIDVLTVSQARKTRYGSGTLAESIDGVISNGYNQFTPLSKSFGHLSNGNRTYNLNSKLEIDYAEIALRNLVNIF